MGKILLPGEDDFKELTPRDLRDWEDEYNEHRTHVPSLWIVHKKNPYFKVGTRLRRFRDGYEEVLLDGAEAVGYGERVYDHDVIAPFIMAIQKRGLDSGAARQDRQRAMRSVGEN